MCKITSFKYINNNSKTTILYLHGWGCNINYMFPLTSKIKKWNCLLIDLPGFGNNKKLNSPKTFLEIIDDILFFIKSNDFKIDYVIGHSFGGKLAAFLSTKLTFKHVFLLSPSIYNKRRFISYYFKVYLYKLIKSIFPKSKILRFFGSKDYKQLDGVMKKTMSNVINFKMDNIIKHIDVGTSLFFGKNDKITPLYLGKKINRNISDSFLHIINGDHFAYLENINYINRIIESVINNDN